MDRDDIVKALDGCKKAKRNLTVIIESAMESPHQCHFWSSDRIKLMQRHNSSPRIKIKIDGVTKTITVRNIIYCIVTGTKYTRLMNIKNTCGTENCLNPYHMKQEGSKRRPKDDDAFDDTSSYISTSSECLDSLHDDPSSLDLFG